MTADLRIPATALALIVLALGLPALGQAAGAPTAALAPAAHLYDAKGNLLITDQFNNRVIEVDPATNAIVWSFGTGDPATCRPGPHSVIAPNDAERIGSGYTLIAGTGTTACPDNRVLVVDRAGQIVWQYGKGGRTGRGPDLLNTPVFAVQLPDHHILITDQGNNRIIEVTLAHQIVWSYGPTSGPGALNSPNSAERLANGDTLIADENNNRVIEVNPAGTIVWSYATGLNTVAFASRLPNGDTLIVDSGHNRVIEVTRQGTLVWQYYTNTSAGSNPAPNPTGAVRTASGLTVIADQFNDRVIEVNASGSIVYQYGETNVVGNGTDQLNAPYSAEYLGDHTGQTVPPARFRP